MAERALALVVRGTDWSETSRIATLFTREHGKVRALAKGGRRLRSSFEVAFDLLTVCEVMYLRKAHGGLDLLTEARVAERFPALRTDLPALYAGYYVAELLADGTQDYDPHPALFDAAIATLRRLGNDPRPSPPRPFEGEGDSGSLTPPGPSFAKGGEEDSGVPRGGKHGDSNPPPFTPPEPSSSPPLQGGGEDAPSPSSTPHSELHVPHWRHVSAFELVWLFELGYSPRLDACAACARALAVPPQPTVRVAFSPEAGGVVCPACQPAARDRRPLSDPAWAALLALAAAGPDARPPTPPPPAVRREVRAVLGQTVSYVLGRRPRLLGYVDGG